MTHMVFVVLVFEINKILCVYGMLEVYISTVVDVFSNLRYCNNYFVKSYCN